MTKKSRKWEFNIMAIYRMVAKITQYICEAVLRIFGPNDDAYPNIGVQPFTGEPFKAGMADIW